MDLDLLENRIPYQTLTPEVGLQSLTVAPYPAIRLRMPGRHWKETVPLGGDFVVLVTDAARGWHDHAFTHHEIFRDVEAKYAQTPQEAQNIISLYLRVVRGEEVNGLMGVDIPGTIATPTLLRAVQCLAVAENRRYGRFNSRGGGKWLPLRYAWGIAHGHWNAAQAIDADRRMPGRPGVEHLERQCRSGMPHAWRA